MTINCRHIFQTQVQSSSHSPTASARGKGGESAFSEINSHDARPPGSFPGVAEKA